MKKISILSLLIFSFNTILAQTNKLSEEERNKIITQHNKEQLANTANCELIILGKQINKSFTYYAKIDGQKHIYTGKTIQILKVIKGSTDLHAIELLWDLGGQIIIEKDGQIVDIVTEEKPINDYTIDYIPTSHGFVTDSGYFCLNKMTISKLNKQNQFEEVVVFKPIDMIAIKNYSSDIKFYAQYNQLEFTSLESLHKSMGLPYDKTKSVKKKEQEKLRIQNKSEINKQKFKTTELKINQKKQDYINNQHSSSSTSESCKEPFFSEFLNGTNLNKALEIFNPRTTALNLHGFVIKAGLIGQTTLISISLSGTIQPKGTYVISNVSADSSIVSVANLVINDSALLSAVRITLEDSTGRIYDKIGSTQLIEWLTISIPFYASHSFKRDYNISQGDTNWVTAQTTWNAIPQNDFSNIHRHTNVCSPLSNSINFEFDNFTVSNSSGNNYAEFDIMATSSSGAYLQNAPFWVGYSNSAFIQNVVTNSVITVTRGATFGNSYEDPQTSIWDSLPNMFIVGITDAYTASSWNRPYIGNTPVQVLHFKIEIANCNQNIDFNFLEQATSSFVTLGCPTATEDAITGNYYFFDNVYYSNLTNAAIPPCSIYISQINGSPTAANCIGGDINNIQSKITIQGAYFGATIGKIRMKNSNDGGQSLTTLDDYDIISWSDNVINVLVPNVISSDTLTPSLDPHSVGSGTIRVIHANGIDSTTTSPNVDVRYSLLNYSALNGSNPSFKNRRILSGREGVDHKIKFKISDRLNQIPGAKDCVAKAIRDWRCSTTVNWYFDSLTTSIDTVRHDSICIIGLGANSNASVLASTQRFSKFCLGTSGLNNQISFVNDVDIRFSNTFINDMHFDTTFTQDIPAGKYDFYHIILHELGHAALLGHTNEETDIMYYSVPTGQTQNQRVFYIDYGNLDGGIDVALKSANTNYSNCPIGGAMPYEASGNCTGGTSGDRYISTNSNNTLNIFPNPTSDLLNITYSLTNNNKTQIQIFNSLGQIIKEVVNQQTAGTYTLSVDTKAFANGIYYIRFSDGVDTKQAKVIVQ